MKFPSIILLLIIFSGCATELGQDAPVIVDAGYGPSTDLSVYKVNLTINSSRVLMNISDFPVYVNLSMLPASFWGNVTQNGSDIRVAYGENTSNLLPREVSAINVTAKTGELYFKANITNASSSVFAILFGNASLTEPTSSNAFGKNKVWNSNWTYVQHFNSNPALGGKVHNDSTGYGNNGTALGSMVASNVVADSLGGYAWSFDGTDDFLTLADNAALEPADNLTIILFQNPTGTLATGYQNKGPIGKFGDLQWIFQNPSGACKMWFTIWHTARSDTNGSTPCIAAWTWNIATWNGTSNTFVNGTKNANGTSQTGQLEAGATNMTIGRYELATSSTSWQAQIGEVRIANTSLPDNYLQTMMNNLIFPQTFMTVGTVEVQSDPAGPPATGIYWLENLTNQTQKYYHNLTIDFNASNSSLGCLVQSYASNSSLWPINSGTGVVSYSTAPNESMISDTVVNFTAADNCSNTISQVIRINLTNVSSNLIALCAGVPRIRFISNSSFINFTTNLTTQSVLANGSSNGCIFVLNATNETAAMQFQARANYTNTSYAIELNGINLTSSFQTVATVSVGQVGRYNITGYWKNASYSTFPFTLTARVMP